MSGIGIGLAGLSQAQKLTRIGLALLELALVAVVLLSKSITDLARADYAADPAGATAVMLVNLVLFVTALAAVLREMVVIIQYRMYA